MKVLLINPTSREYDYVEELVENFLRDFAPRRRHNGVVFSSKLHRPVYIWGKADGQISLHCGDAIDFGDKP